MTKVNVFKKRFIAGAVCPDCQIVDRIVVETGTREMAQRDLPNAEQTDEQRAEEQLEVSRRRCVACGFADEFSIDSRVNSQGVPRGKPERPKSNATKSVTPAQAVKILDPGAPRKP